MYHSFVPKHNLLLGKKKKIAISTAETTQHTAPRVPEALLVTWLSKPGKH